MPDPATNQTNNAAATQGATGKADMDAAADMIGSTLAKPATPPPDSPSAQAAPNGGVTMDQARQMIENEFRKTDAERTLGHSRTAFIKSNLDGLPAVYTSQLGNDPNQWEQESQRIRDQFDIDMRRAKGAPPVDNYSGRQPPPPVLPHPESPRDPTRPGAINYTQAGFTPEEAISRGVWSTMPNGTPSSPMIQSGLPAVKDGK